MEAILVGCLQQAGRVECSSVTHFKRLLPIGGFILIDEYPTNHLSRHLVEGMGTASSSDQDTFLGLEADHCRETFLCLGT